MISKIIIAFSYAFYAALLFAALGSPTEIHMSMIDNAKTLFYILHTPIYLIMTFILVTLNSSNFNWSSFVEKELAKMNDFDRKKALQVVTKRKNIKPFLFLNRLFMAFVAVTSFIVLDEVFLCLFIMFGMILGVFLLSVVDKIGKEIQDNAKS